jgi:MFS family permease
MATADPLPSGARAGRLATGRGRVALGLLCMAFLVDVMGATSVFTASPAIGLALHLSAAELQWAITAATLPAGALLLAGGRLADQFGPRRMFLAGLAVLLAASLACGLAPGAAVLIAARSGQGAAGALLIPAALSLILRTFDGEAEQRTALAAWSAIGGIGATAGLLIGGVVTAGLGWRWVFLINVPVAALMLTSCPLVLARPARRGLSRPASAAGTTIFSAGTALVIYAISQVPALGWSNWRTLGPGLAGIVLLAALGRTGKASASPVVPWLAWSRTIIAGNATMLAAGMFVDGMLFILTLFTQRIWGYSALQFGGAAAAMTTTSVAASWAAQRMIARHGTRPVTATGLVLLCLTAVAITMTTRAGGGTVLLIVGMVLFGAGMGWTFTAGSVASLHGVSDRDAGVAAAVQNIAFTVGSALGVAILSTVAATTSGHLSPNAATATTDALTAGYRAAFVAAGIIAVFALIAVIIITSRQPRQARQPITVRRQP